MIVERFHEFCPVMIYFIIVISFQLSIFNIYFLYFQRASLLMDVVFQSLITMHLQNSSKIFVDEENETLKTYEYCTVRTDDGLRSYSYFNYFF